MNDNNFYVYDQLGLIFSWKSVVGAVAGIVGAAMIVASIISSAPVSVPIAVSLILLGGAGVVSDIIDASNNIDNAPPMIEGAIRKEGGDNPNSNWMQRKRALECP